MNRRNSIRVIGLLASAAVVVAACGSSGSEGGGGGATTVADSSGGGTTVADSSGGEGGGTTVADSTGGDGATTAPSGEGGEGGGGGGSVGGALDYDAVMAADLANCEPAPTGDPIKVGMALDFSEVVGFVDIPGSKIAPYFASLINCVGGFEGQPVEVKVEDVGGTAEGSAVAAQSLLDWGALFIIGPPFADFANPILQATEGKVPVFVAASTEPTLANAEQNSFLVTFDDTAQATAAAEWALGEGITRAFVFTQPGPYTGYNPDVFSDVFTAGGGEIVSEQTYVWGEDTDFSTQVSELSGILQGDEAFYSAAITPQITALRGQLEGAGFKDITYIGTDGPSATGIEADPAGEGVVHTPHTFIKDGDPIDILLKRYETDEGEPIDQPTFMGLYIDSLMLGLQAIKDCGCTDSEGIGNAVREIEGFQGTTGVITYKGTNGIPPKKVPVVRVEDGADVLLNG